MKTSEIQIGNDVRSTIDGRTGRVVGVLPEYPLWEVQWDEDWKVGLTDQIEFIGEGVAGGAAAGYVV